MQNQSKIYVVAFIASLFFLTSCSLTDNVCKDGIGEVIFEERNLTNFTAIESRGSYIINLFQDTSIKEQTVLVAAQESIIGLIQTRIVGNSLIIDTGECYTTDEEVSITVRTPALSQIVLAGSGDIILQDTVRKPQIEFVLNGSGTIFNLANAPIIAPTSCSANLKGSGNIDLNFDATTIVNASVDGSGTITLKGEAAENNLNISGSGNIKAFDLPVLSSTAELLGSGVIELTANDPDSTLNTSRAKANIQVSGSGVVRVKGNGSVKWNISGSGRIERVD